MYSTQPVQGNQLFTGCLLTSASSKYRVQKYLGQGTFGTVVKCKRMNDGEIVAIKMMKSEHFWKAKEEAAILRKLKSLDPEKSNLVRWYQMFKDRGQLCLEFEHLDKSLYDLMRERRFQPLPLKHVRPIVKQLANALNYLRAARIIHADLKLENVMLVNQQVEPYRVKVIDFGLSSDVRFTTVGSYIQTRPFRSPEVILGLPLTEAIDMWSLGCMVVFLYLGTMLYSGDSEYDVIRNIIKTQGQLPHSMLCQGRKTHLYFMKDKRSTTSLWKLKNPEQVRRDKRKKPVEKQKCEMTSLDDLLYTHSINSDNNADQDAQWKDVQMFVNMVKEMLQLDTDTRITPSQLMQHRFTRMLHIINLYPRSKYVRDCSDMMTFCQKNKTQGRATQQPSTRTASPHKHHCINPSPGSRNQTSQRSHGSWVNSKVVDVKNTKNTDTVVTNHPSMTATEVRSHPNMTVTATRPHLNTTDTATRSHLNMTDNAVWSHLDMTNTAVKSDHNMTIRKKIAEYYDVKPKLANKKYYSDNSSSHTNSASPSIPSSSRGAETYVPTWDKRKVALSEDCDHNYDVRSDLKRQRAENYSADRSPCNSNHDSTHIVPDPSYHRCRPEEQRPSDSTWNERHVCSGQKRKAGATAGSHKPGCSNRPESTHTDQFHSNQRRPDKHVQHNSPHSPDSPLAKRRVLSVQKRKIPPEEEVRPTRRTCDHWLDETQTIQRGSAAQVPSTSGCSDRHESTHTDHFHLNQRRRSDKHPNCPHSTNSTLIKRPVRSGRKRKAPPEEEDVLPSKRTCDHSLNNRKLTQSSAGPKTSECSISHECEDVQMCMLMSRTPDVHLLPPNTEPVEDNTFSPKHPTCQGR
ncbi:homeodomain-interacting protein kinase 2-like [Solea solea]|uniref:homeodomain-interacting protein kinase 2-like n=1 Tax=Solea solea TaxID=90069 RepID=UPI00272BFD6B|nr:homeodomain-interacting protein kinase 2-like [Solea solea]